MILRRFFLVMAALLLLVLPGAAGKVRTFTVTPNPCHVNDVCLFTGSGFPKNMLISIMDGSGGTIIAGVAAAGPALNYAYVFNSSGVGFEMQVQDTRTLAVVAQKIFTVE